MMTFPTKARTDKDGRLSISIPTGMRDSEVDVLVVVDPAVPESAIGQKLPANDWPESYFAETFGSLHDAGLERPPQGELPERLPIDPAHG
jgi:hypothetical protein